MLRSLAQLNAKERERIQKLRAMKLAQLNLKMMTQAIEQKKKRDK